MSIYLRQTCRRVRPIDVFTLRPARSNICRRRAVPHEFGDLKESMAVGFSLIGSVASSEFHEDFPVLRQLPTRLGTGIRLREGSKGRAGGHYISHFQVITRSQYLLVFSTGSVRIQTGDGNDGSATLRLHETTRQHQ